MSGLTTQLVTGGGGGSSSGMPSFLVATHAVNQTLISTGTLFTFSDVIYSRAAGEIALAAGVFTLPGGKYWRATCGVVVLSAALAIEITYQWRQAPAGANTAIGLPGLTITANNVAAEATGGLGGDAVAYIDASGGPVDIALRCLTITAGQTATSFADYTKVIIEEVGSFV